MNKFLEIAASIYQGALDKHEAKIINNILAMESFDSIINEKPQQISRISFVVPTLKRFAGGHTSILRLGTYLANNNIDVVYISFHNQSTIEMEEIAHSNLSSVKGKFLKYQDCKQMASDVCIATSWESVYWANQLYGYKVYFVQDYEPYFFKLNERYLLAKKTYELGFHIISLGKWNLEQIKHNCNITGNMDYVDFPYEPKEYTLVERNYLDYKTKKCFSIAVYTKEEGKRIPNLLQGILGRSKTEFQKNGIELKIYFFGLKSNHKVTIGKNLGKLSKDELINLYQNSDFGLVASMTNISLVPFEMIATGLPVIEFAEGSYTDFLPEDSAILIDFNSQTLVNKIKSYINKPEDINVMVKNARAAIDKLSWDNTGKQFLDILRKKIGKD